jgi:dTDP-4-dehydrorhamnose 3,5-epimerase
MISLSDFKDDAPWVQDPVPFAPINPADLGIATLIEGVRLRRLLVNRDGRGNLTVLMSDLYAPEDTTPHVYLVTAAARSIRAWVYHKRQSDRLAFTQGNVRVVLYDLRPESPTYGVLNVLDVGEANRLQLTIPPFVVHAVQNRGDQDAQFVNMPTRAYDPACPDKSRLPADHPGIPYAFD